MDDVYTHGHHESVLRSHRWRTAQNSAAYALEHLYSGMDLLDVGCGPGTITRELARIVAPGRTVGIDASADVIAQAAQAAQAEAVAPIDSAAAVEFAVGDVYALDASDDSFDVVHAHQVLQHLTDPVRALTEMRRVLRPDGLLAVRDSDYAGFVWSPADARLDRWLALYHEVTRRNGAEPDAGRHLLAWVRRAGFRDAVLSSSTWSFADDDARRWWGGLWADRCRYSAFAEQAVAYGSSTSAELADLASAWDAWAAEPDGCFVVLHCEVLARK